MVKCNCLWEWSWYKIDYKSINRLINEIILVLIILVSCGTNEVKKPNPKKIPFEMTQHGDT